MFNLKEQNNNHFLLKKEIDSDIDYCVKNALKNKITFLDLSLGGVLLEKFDLIICVDKGKMEFICPTISKDKISLERIILESKKYNNNNIFIRSRILYNPLKKIGAIVNRNKHWSFNIPICYRDLVTEYKGVAVLGVCSGKEYKHVIPFPFFYCIKRDSLGVANPEPKSFMERFNKVCFVGSPSGVSKESFIKDGITNQRLNFCDWASSFEEDIYSKLVIKEFFGARSSFWGYSDFKNSHKFMLKNRVNIEDQLKNKYQLHMDGRSTAWLRLPWQLNSNSVVMYLEPYKKNNNTYHSQYYEWYYCLFDKLRLENKKLPFIYVNMDNILNIKRELDNNIEMALSYVRSAKKFYNDYLNDEVKFLYVEKLFERINEEYVKQSKSFIFAKKVRVLIKRFINKIKKV